MTLDPLFTLLVGALGASLVGLLGAWIQSQREHDKWLRERRFEAYRAFMVDMHTAQSLVGTKPTSQIVGDFKQRLKAYNENAAHAFEAVSLLGPLSVNRAGQAWTEALLSFTQTRDAPQLASLESARWQFLVVAGAVLRSRNVRKSPGNKGA